MDNKIKYIPAILSLMAGLIASIIAITSHYDTLHIMIIILAALLIFFIVGSIVRAVFEKNFVIKEEENKEDSETSEDEEGETAPEGEQALEDNSDSETE